MSIWDFCTQDNVKMRFNKFKTRFNDDKMRISMFKRDVMRFDHLKCKIEIILYSYDYNLRFLVQGSLTIL